MGVLPTVSASALTAALLGSHIAAQDQSCHRSFQRLGAAPLRVPPKIRDRESFPDSHLSWMPEVAAAPGAEFPGVFRHTGDRSISAAGRELRELADADLARLGAIVVKGLPLDSAQDFSTLMHASGMNLVDYVGGVTSRPVLAPKVTPASSEGDDVCMESHNDNPHWLKPPTRLSIYARRAPQSGGQAFLTDGRATLRSMRAQYPEIAEEFRKRGVRYEHFYPDREKFEGEVLTSWQDSFAPQIKEDCTNAACNATTTVERVLEAGGYGFKWTETGLMKWEVRDAIMAHWDTSEETWCNEVTAMHCTVFDNHPAYPEFRREPRDRQAACDMHGAMPYHTKFGDGGQIPVAVTQAVRRMQWANTVSFEYEDGDVVLIDNYNTMHGRFSFEPPREIFLVMVAEI